MSHYDAVAIASCGGIPPPGQPSGYLSPSMQQQYTPSMSQSASNMDYSSSPTCSMYDYQMSVNNKAHDSMISPPPQHSPGSYYSPPATLHQVPVEGTITATSCSYNSYYPYGMSASPVHGQTSPLSSQHSSPVMPHSSPTGQMHHHSLQTTLM